MNKQVDLGILGWRDVLRDVRIAETLSKADAVALTADLEAIARRLEGK